PHTPSFAATKAYPANPVTLRAPSSLRVTSITQATLAQLTWIASHTATLQPKHGTQYRPQRFARLRAMACQRLGMKMNTTWKLPNASPWPARSSPITQAHYRRD